MAGSARVVLPLRAPLEAMTPAAHWRSTWVLSSIQTLRTRGLFDRYVRNLPAAVRDEVVLAVAGVWLPMRIARAHYEACDALALPRAEVLEMGIASGARAQGTVLKTALTMASSAGVTPWTMFPQFHRLWERGADGGDARVYELGPKEALLETFGCELFDVPYFRVAFSGVILGIINPCCSKAFVRDETSTARGSCALRFQWV